MAAIAAIIPAVISIFGSMQQKRAAKKQTKALQDLKDFEIKQAQQNATQAVAAAQRDMLDERKRTDLLISRAQAVAAAGGGSATDPSVVHIIGDIGGEGAYREALAMYQGEALAHKLRTQATALGMEKDIIGQGGRDQQRALNTQIAGQAASGFGSMYTKYSQSRTNSNLASGASLKGNYSYGSYGGRTDMDTEWGRI